MTPAFKILSFLLVLCLLISFPTVFFLPIAAHDGNSDEVAEITGYTAFVNERGIILYFCFTDKDVGKTMVITVGTVVKKYTVIAGDRYCVGISLKPDQLDTKIAVSYYGNVIKEYSLKQYLKDALNEDDITTKQQEIAEAILLKKDYGALLP